MSESMHKMLRLWVYCVVTTLVVTSYPLILSACECGCDCKENCECGCMTTGDCACMPKKENGVFTELKNASNEPKQHIVTNLQQVQQHRECLGLYTCECRDPEEVYLSCFSLDDDHELTAWECSGSDQDDKKCPNCNWDYFPYYSVWPGLGNGNCFDMKGTWMPEKPPLFRPLIADPRQPNFSVGWRFNDNVLAKNVIPVSFADDFPVYRLEDVWPWHGKMQIDIEGALWAVFDPCDHATPLINADYMGGLTATYAIPCWDFRLRAFHISSHLGDEFLIINPGFDRRNPSAEYLDFFVSNELTNNIRIYSGLGALLHQDCSFKTGYWYAEAGLEMRLWEAGYMNYPNFYYGVPFYAMHFRWKNDFKHHIDMTYALGYEFGKTIGLQRRMRAYIEYHDGYSVEGQFCREATSYLSLKVTYGF